MLGFREALAALLCRGGARDVEEKAVRGMSSLFRRIVNAIKGEDAAQKRSSSCATSFNIVGYTNEKASTGANGKAPTSVSRGLSGGSSGETSDPKRASGGVRSTRMGFPRVKKGYKSPAEKSAERRRKIEAAAPPGMVYDGDSYWSEEKQKFVPRYITPEQAREKRRQREKMEALEKELAEFYDFRGVWRP